MGDGLGLENGQLGQTISRSAKMPLGKPASHFGVPDSES